MVGLWGDGVESRDFFFVENGDGGRWVEGKKKVIVVVMMMMMMMGGFVFCEGWG